MEAHVSFCTHYHTPVMSVEFDDDIDEDIPHDEMLFYPSDNPTDSDDDTL